MDSPNAVGSARHAQVHLLAGRHSELMRPSCGRRFSEMFRFAMTLMREVTGSARCFGGGAIS